MQFCIKKNGQEYLELAKRLPTLEAPERERLSVLQTEFSACVRQVMEASSVESLPKNEWERLSGIRSWAKSILFLLTRVEALDPELKEQFGDSLDFLDRHHPSQQEHTHAPSTASAAMAMA